MGSGGSGTDSNEGNGAVSVMNPMSEQPMQLTPSVPITKSDGALAEAAHEMTALEKLAIEAGVDPRALALLYEGEKR